MIEILLTATAWRKGWRGAALLPMAIGIPVGVMLAGSSHSIAPAVMADVAIYVTLITMIIKGRKVATVA